jgi:hypothetical protein
MAILLIVASWSIRALAQGFVAIPEPGLAICGTITDSNGLPCLPVGGLNWVIRTGSSSVNVTSSIVCIGGAVWHVSEVRFETRRVAEEPALPASANAFELTPSTNAYSRGAWFGKVQCSTVNPWLSNFTFSSRDRGRLDRVDLRIAQFFGNQDSDGDGVPDWAEIVAGTDPHDPHSLLKIVSSVRGDPQGGITIEWLTVPGRTYAIFSSTNLTSEFLPRATNILANGASIIYHDSAAIGPGPFFYRIKLTEPQ